MSDSLLNLARDAERAGAACQEAAAVIPLLTRYTEARHIELEVPLDATLDPKELRRMLPKLQAVAGDVANAYVLLGCMQHLGGARAMFERACAYVRTRNTDAGLLASQAAVRETIADIYVGLFTAQIVCRNSISAAPEWLPSSVAATRIIVLNAARSACEHACQLHGGVATIAGEAMDRLARRQEEYIQAFGGRAYWADEAPL